jgi:uncharacterized membrane protein
MPFFGVIGFSAIAANQFVVAYPPIPWLGIMLVGFASGNYLNCRMLKEKNNSLKLDWEHCRFL